MGDFDLVSGIVFYAVFLFSVTLHEAGHAWAAKRGGDLTAYLGGQVSIDPMPHIRREPFGMVLLPLLGIAMIGWPLGYASTPYNVAWSRSYPRRAAWMSLAGPAANLALMLAAVLFVRIGLGMGSFAIPDSVGFSQITVGSDTGLSSTLALLVSVLFSMNLVLLLLNMIPLPPLDGSGAVLLLLPQNLTTRYQDFIAQPIFAWIGILIAWYAIGELFHPTFLFAVNLLYPTAQFG